MTWILQFFMNTLDSRAFGIPWSGTHLYKIWGVCQEMFVKRCIILCYVWFILALESSEPLLQMYMVSIPCKCKLCVAFFLN